MTTKMFCPVYGTVIECDPTDISFIPDCVIDGWVGKCRACGSEPRKSNITEYAAECIKEIK